MPVYYDRRSWRWSSFVFSFLDTARVLSTSRGVIIVSGSNYWVWPTLLRLLEARITIHKYIIQASQWSFCQHKSVAHRAYRCWSSVKPSLICFCALCITYNLIFITELAVVYLIVSKRWELCSNVLILYVTDGSIVLSPYETLYTDTHTYWR